MASSGKYELHEQIGQGGFAKVYRATHKLLETEAAVKVLKHDRLRDPIARERMIREAKIAAGLKHANIVDIFDLIQEKDTLAIAMEYVRGGNLRQWLKHNQPDTVTLLSILAQVAEALDYIHSQHYQSDRPLLHRDVKPENVLMDSDPVTAKPKAKLSDFGLVSDPQRALPVAGIPGTAYYISPEQAEGVPLEALDGRVDQYALAVMAYELLSGARPFDGNDPLAVMTKRLDDDALLPPSQVNPDLPVEFDEPILKALSKLPEHRYPTCADFVRKLTEAAQASRLRQVREWVDAARRAAENGDFKSARADLEQAEKIEPGDARIISARKVINVQAENAQRYAEAVQAWQTARQKAHAVLDLAPDFPDPKGLLVTLEVRQPPKKPLDLRSWLIQVGVGILLAVPFALLFTVLSFLWILNH